MRYTFLLLIVVATQLVGCQTTTPVKAPPAKVELVSAIDTQPPARGFGSSNPALATDSQATTDNSVVTERSASKARKGKASRKSSKLSKKGKRKVTSTKSRRSKASKRRSCR